MIEFVQQCCLLADRVLLALAHGLHLPASCGPVITKLIFSFFNNTNTKVIVFIFKFFYSTVSRKGSELRFGLSFPSKLPSRILLNLY